MQLAEKPPADDTPFFPGTLTATNVVAACAATPFPTLEQNPAVTSAAHVYVVFFAFIRDRSLIVSLARSIKEEM